MMQTNSREKNVTLPDSPPDQTVAWGLLALAGCFEIAWAVGLKYTYGFTRVLPSFLTLAAMGLSFLFLSQALKIIPLGTAYAVWTGIGAVGTVLLGIVLFQEPANPLRILCILLIVCGMVGLKTFGSG
jgi:quaternary ammonium compound-resistance protein SugE